MRAAINDPTLNPPTSANSTTNENDSWDFVEVLQELLADSIHLRDMYKNARWQTADIPFRRLSQLFDGHYKEQIRLVDILIDRLRALNAGKVFAGDFLHRPPLSQLLRGRLSATCLLMKLVEVHESVLNAALPIQANDAQINPPWTGDFAVGQVVLSNDLQLFAVREEWIDRKRTRQREPTSHA